MPCSILVSEFESDCNLNFTYLHSHPASCLPLGCTLTYVTAQLPAFLPTSSTYVHALFAFHLAHVLIHFLPPPCPSSHLTPHPLAIICHHHAGPHSATTLALTPTLVPHTSVNAHTPHILMHASPTHTLALVPHLHACTHLPHLICLLSCHFQPCWHTTMLALCQATSNSLNFFCLHSGFLTFLTLMYCYIP